MEYKEYLLHKYAGISTKDLIKGTMIAGGVLGTTLAATRGLTGLLHNAADSLVLRDKAFNAMIALDNKMHTSPEFNDARGTPLNATRIADYRHAAKDVFNNLWKLNPKLMSTPYFARNAVANALATNSLPESLMLDMYKLPNNRVGDNMDAAITGSAAGGMMKRI